MRRRDFSGCHLSNISSQLDALDAAIRFSQQLANKALKGIYSLP